MLDGLHCKNEGYSTMQLIDVLVDYKVNRIYSLLWKKKKKHSKKVLRRQQQQLFYFKFYFFNAKQWMESSVYRQLEKQTVKKKHVHLCKHTHFVNTF